MRREAVYLMRPGYAVRLPTPPPFHNKGNWIFSLAQLGRHLAEQAEELGAMVLPETAAQTLLVEDGAVRGIVTGDKGLDREGRPTAAYEPGIEIRARATVLCEGTQGHLAGALAEEFSLRTVNPQVWSLGVKEVWKVARPLNRVIHTLGWPLRWAGKHGETGGSFIYPMGDDRLTIGLVVGLEHHDASLSVHDLLQQFKTHPMIRELLEGGEREAWGAKTIPEGGLLSVPDRISRAGGARHGRLGGLRERAQAEGHPLRDAIRDARGRDGARGAEGGRRSRRAGSARRLRPAGEGEPHLARPAPGAQHAPGADQGPRRRRRPGEHDGPDPGRLPGRHVPHPGATPTPSSRVEARDYPEPDGSLTFDKLSSVFLSGNRSRDDQPNHIRIRERVPMRGGAGVGRDVPGRASTSCGEPSGDGMVEVELTPSNCVQCGAITAKGGRLTPPEGGSGPEYSIV